ncbi:transcriptional regulator [Kitasatospora sp. NPDC006697]|uniref:transcriptional regulator n=1 Tax=Kitasatospora sp. NPDC006697 TaxID=3364020 RepID=UPI003680F92C
MSTRTEALPRRHAKSRRGSAFESALGELAAQRATGALHGTAGTAWLADGAVVGVHSPYTADAPPPCAERELAWHGMLLDAAYFAFGQDCGSLGFHPGPPPEDGGLRALPFERLGQAIRCRRALLDQVCPHPELDTAAVATAPTGSALPAPARRLAELLAAVDGALTPHQLACRLRRSTFGVLLDVRLLAAAGLLHLPPGAGEAAVRSALDPADPEVALLLRIRSALEARL